MQPEAITECLQDGASLIFITNAWKQEIIGKKYYQTSKYVYLFLHKFTRYQPFSRSIGFVREQLFKCYQTKLLCFYFRHKEAKCQVPKLIPSTFDHQFCQLLVFTFLSGRRRRVPMVIEFTCQISVLTLLLLFRWWDGEVYSIHFYVIKCFFYLRLVDHSVSELLSVDHSVSELLSVDSF